MRQIDADTLLEKVAKIHPWEPYPSKYAQGIRHCMEVVSCLIQDAPTIEPSAQPEIIRCKDCKWWSNDDYRECSNPNYDDGYVTPAGFYCGYAERRTDEQT